MVSIGLCLATTVLGCVSIPGRRYALESIEISGNDALSDSDIEAQIATRESPRFLAVFTGLVYDYEVFDRYVLERDLQRIERYYRSRGYYWPRVRAGRVFNTGERKVSVEIVVDEGPATHVGRVDVHGIDTLPPDISEEAREEVTDALSVGERFEEADFEAAAETLQRVLADHGYAYATVRRAADVDITENVVSAGYWVDAGPIVRIGEIRISGLGGIPEDEVRRTLQLRPGALYSATDLEDAERALLDLGVFSAASVKPDLEQTEPTEARDVVPVDVNLQVSRFHSVHAGVGVQVDSQRTDTHLVVGWENRNFLGGLRYFLAEFVPGAVVFPTRLPDLEAPERLLPQARLRLELRQPDFFEAQTQGVLRLQGGLAPVLLSSARDPGAPVLGYRDLRASAGLERKIYRDLHGALSQNVQISDPFTYVGEEDAALITAVVSYPEILLRLDARNNPLEPTRGVYVSNTLQVAGVGGDARDVRIQPEVRGYIPLAPKLTLSMRGSVGFLFAQNYGDTIDEVSRATGGEMPPDLDEGDRAARNRDIQLMYLRGFFGGGPGSNRGYALREIGPHGQVPFYNPNQADEACYLSAEGARAPASCRLPLGGFSLWEASLELRFPLIGPLRGALFTDMGDVSPEELNLRWNYLHLSAGVGLRLSTPVGPVRLDVGYRVPGLQGPEDPSEFEPDELFGLPIAISFGIGEAF